MSIKLLLWYIRKMTWIKAKMFSYSFKKHFHHGLLYCVITCEAVFTLLTRVVNLATNAVEVILSGSILHDKVQYRNHSMAKAYCDNTHISFAT